MAIVLIWSQEYAGSSPVVLTTLWGMIELGFLAALQAVIDGFDSHILHQIYYGDHVMIIDSVEMTACAHTFQPALKVTLNIPLELVVAERMMSDDQLHASIGKDLIDSITRFNASQLDKDLCPVG